MATSRRTRTAVAAGALVALLAPLAVVAGGSTATAAAKGLKPHHTKVYKVEKHLDLAGEFPDNKAHEHLSCEPGDIATDGMWRVDHVDQANPQAGTSGDERDVRVTSSYGDSADWSKWHFELTNHATADAQVKLWVVCLERSTTKREKHRHDMVVSGRKQLAVASFDDDKFLYADAQCDEGYYAIAPGFHFPTGKARLFHSWPTDDHRGWEWRFKIDEDGDDGYLFHRCLKSVTDQAGAGHHVHELGLDWYGDTVDATPDHQGVQLWLRRSETATAELSCSDHGKAIVGGFYFHAWDKIWWLGQDPRPKTRTHKFWTTHDWQKVWLDNLCLDGRTGPQQELTF